ncbi:hypothetical protein [Vibrio metschnikovii]|uniref:hypothetical protein n=1 Tax=Vibrio metschnikovii TaxID=28172 RepID=UPI002FCC7FCA
MDINEHYYQRVNSAFDDLLECIDFCNALSEIASLKSVLCKALTISVIVTYARCFVSAYSWPHLDNVGSKELKNKYSDLTDSWLKTLSDEMKCFHDSILKRRNTAIAHSDAAARDYFLTSAKCVLIGRNPHLIFENHELIMIRRLIESFLSIVAREHTLIRKSIAQPNT